MFSFSTSAFIPVRFLPYSCASHQEWPGTNRKSLWAFQVPPFQFYFSVPWPSGSTHRSGPMLATVTSGLTRHFKNSTFKRNTSITALRGWTVSNPKCAQVRVFFQAASEAQFTEPKWHVQWENMNFQMQGHRWNYVVWTWLQGLALKNT